MEHDRTPRNDLAADYVRRRFSYDRESGRLMWLPIPNISVAARRWNGRNAGKEAGCVVKSNMANGLFYRQVRLDGVLYLAQRLIWLIVTGAWPIDRVDHFDRNGINNKWNNLREANAISNQGNRGLRKDNPSGYKGVRRHRGGQKWTARITENYKSIHLGTHLSAESAARAYDAAARKHFGAFALTNFPST